MKAKIENGQVIQYPYTLQDLKADHRGTVFDPNDIPWSAYPNIVDVAGAEMPAGQVVVETTPAWIDGVLTQQWEARDFTVAELEKIRDAKAREIDADFAAACDAIRAGYPPDEILSWPQQQLEAEAWAADNAAPTPLLAAMASARGVPVPELATRILANVAAYKAAYGQALGERQRRQAELAAVDLGAEGVAEAIAAV